MASARSSGRGAGSGRARPSRRAGPLRRCEQALRRHALSLPEAREEFPWGESAFKVKRKVFLFLSHGPGRLSLSVKLPESREVALMLPFAEPTGYGLGKSGWVSAAFEGRGSPPVDLLRAWVDESYRAIAPRALAERLAIGAGAGVAARPSARVRAPRPRGAGRRRGR